MGAAIQGFSLKKVNLFMYTWGVPAVGLIFCIFWWRQQNISHNLGKIFKCIWKILFSPFRECYVLLGSELPLARCQPLKIQGFSILFFWLSTFFIFLPSISHKRKLQSQLTITSSEKNSNLSVTLNFFFSNCGCFAVISRKYKKRATLTP